MRLRTLIVAGALAAGLLAAAPSSASANILWCIGDPPVQVLTPGGHYLVVNNYLYVSPVYRHLAKKVTVDGYAIPDGALGTLVTVRVHVPSGMSHLFVVSAQQRYRVTTSGAGGGGQEITLTLDVPES